MNDASKARWNKNWIEIAWYPLWYFLETRGFLKCQLSAKLPQAGWLLLLELDKLQYEWPMSEKKHNEKITVVPY